MVDLCMSTHWRFVLPMAHQCLERTWPGGISWAMPQSTGSAPAVKGARPVQECARRGSGLQMQPSKNIFGMMWRWETSSLCIYNGLQTREAPGDGLCKLCPMVRARSTQPRACCMSGCPQAPWSPSSAVPPASQLVYAPTLPPSSEQMGWGLFVLGYSTGTNNFCAALPAPLQPQPDGFVLLCNTCQGWQAAAFSLGRKIKVSPSLPK